MTSRHRWSAGSPASCRKGTAIDGLFRAPFPSPYNPHAPARLNLKSMPPLCFPRNASSAPIAACKGLNSRFAATFLAATLWQVSVADQLSSAVTTEQLLFLQAWRAVDRAYVDKSFNGQSWFKLREQFLRKEPMRDRGETYAAIRKLLSTLDDPFTRFLEPERYAALRRGTSGSISGVGLEVAFSQLPESLGSLLVVTPTPDSPAERAGIEAQDEIERIDGVSFSKQSLYEVAERLQGPAGSNVELQIRSRKTGASRIVELTRVATFNKQTPQLFLEALEGLKADGVSDLVLDLRNNGGGYFPAGVQVARYLINKGDIVLIADDKGVKDIYSANGTAFDTSSHMAVLVNGGTASAAEVLSGALQDNRRAAIVGERTFGKGLIQSVVPLDEDDGSAVVVTVAQYQTPAGIDINKTGIEPDIALRGDSLPISADRVCTVLKEPEAPRLFQ